MNITTIGKQIRTRREEIGMTQTELANAAGLSQPYISQLEQNKFTPAVPALMKIAKTLQIPVGTLLGEERRAV